ncbi:sugar phosphate isomerase/epimerase family protein [Streptomyces clavifer]|uniref:sugar phosphate isomerase/epimerase family protein n=1 Tax=Streptomyces clavifer TaxID=68188 RepID=UPI00367E4591
MSSSWVAEGGGLEAYVFDGNDLAREEHWRTLRDNLRHVTELGVERLTLHFPTENADWVGSAAAFDKLRRFCDLASETGAAGVTLHANRFVSQEDWLGHDLAASRARTVERTAELDAHLADSPLWIGIENLPVIGAQGIDYDSVFVRPEDFAPLLELNSPRVGVTWDICHWAVTYSTLAAMAQLQQQPEPVDAFALPALEVKHIHFSSFRGHAMPFWPDLCTEGVPPQDGDFSESLLAAMLLNTIEAAQENVGVVFEVQEEDYRNRKNCWTTRSWLDLAPQLSGVRTGMRRSDDRAS